ncbi:Sua5/YciO/YrdC/YwlC family protein [Candidatus Nitrosotalea okcheonensis]|uniref:L-threonylcarbamoyladenylate synthase n=2 Tax=Candidatus Nitrosotalea okcheonensis TaxID=1903276 RepID=A0A2H1FFY1_9ARCH|nr:Sua5/YciO/YrdC/YwlC family protein [Candidatus Nitrosotalea okcheonensis]
MIKKAYEIVQKGGTVVFPTDTVYGIGCDPRNQDAVNKIYKIKGREKMKQLPVLAYSKKDIADIAFFDEISEKIADKFWPGPVTLILRVKDKKIEEALDLKGKIAVRVPNHPCVLALLEKCRLLVGTSANLSGESSFSDSKEVASKFSGYDILLDGGQITNSHESTIVEVVDNELKIVREGKIKMESLV